MSLIVIALSWHFIAHNLCSLHSHCILMALDQVSDPLGFLPPVACHWSHVMPIAFPSHSIVFHLCIAFSWFHHMSLRSQRFLGMSLLLCHFHCISKPCQCSPLHAILTPRISYFTQSLSRLGFPGIPGLGLHCISIAFPSTSLHAQPPTAKALHQGLHPAFTRLSPGFQAMSRMTGPMSSLTGPMRSLTGPMRKLTGQMRRMTGQMSSIT